MKAPFKFCLNPDCRVAYNARQSSDLGKLSTIGVDGRSTATTILALSTILKLRVDESLEPDAKKLLSFTDNRQDASLQAGHFNDFVEVGLIRSGLYRAMVRLGEVGLRYDELVHHVERALDLPSYLFANDPDLRGPALEETRRALRSVLAYYLYRDLERGWRVTSPNLEQCGLLEFEYMAIDDVANDQTIWEEKNAHAALVAATPKQQKHVIRILLDHLRRSLAVKEDSLNLTYQERISEQSRQRLREPWVMEDARDMVHAGVAWPRVRMDRERQEDVCISPRSNFGQFLRRSDILPDLGERLSLEDTAEIILSLFQCLKPWGLARLNVKVDRRHDRRALTPDEFAKLIESAVSGPPVVWTPGPDRAMMYVLSAWTGYRKKGIGSLTKRSLRLDDDPPTATVAAAYSKRKRQDTQVLHPEAVNRLRVWLETKKDLGPDDLLFPVSGKVPGGTERRTSKMMKLDLERRSNLCRRHPVQRCPRSPKRPKYEPPALTTPRRPGKWCHQWCQTARIAEERVCTKLHRRRR